MQTFIIGFFLILIVAASDCSSGGNNNGNSLPNVNQSNVPQTTPTPRAERASDLQKRIEAIAAKAKGKVGVAATVLETGEQVFLNQSERFPMQSVYKLPIATAILRQIDDGRLKLEQIVSVEKSDFVRQGQRSPLRDANPNGTKISLAELLRLAVAESDGTASDVLMRVAGGANEVGKYLNELKVEEVTVADSEKEIGRDWATQYRNWATPAGALALLRALHEGRALSETSRTLILKILAESTPGANRLKKLLPPGTVVAHKTGTGGTNKDGVTSATNDIGIINLPNERHLAIAVFVSDSPADETTRERVIAEIARAAWDEWSGE